MQLLKKLELASSRRKQKDCVVKIQTRYLWDGGILAMFLGYFLYCTTLAHCRQECKIQDTLS